MSSRVAKRSGSQLKPRKPRYSAWPRVQIATNDATAAALILPLRASATGHAIPTPAFSLVRVTKKGGPLSKTISRKGDRLEIDSSGCQLTKGEARTVLIEDGMEGLARLYSSLGTNEAVVFSNVNLGLDSREICTEKDYPAQRLSKPNIICRTRKYLPAAAGPGLQLFEVDDHGLPPGVTAPDAMQMLDILEQLLPELDIKHAARLRTHSTSSYVYEAESGKELKGEGGKHLAFVLSDQSRADALKRLLEVRQWAQGYGHIYISRDGRQLERTVFDLSVFSPERLVFESGAVLATGLEQRRPPPAATEGHALDMAALPTPTLKEIELANEAKREAKARSQCAADSARLEYIRDETSRLVEVRRIAHADAEAIVKRRTEAGSLPDGDTLTFTDGGSSETQTVGHVLDHIDKYLGRAMCDPLEPESGRSKAMILRGPGGQPYVNSFAHGGRRYTFDRLVHSDRATDGALFPFTDLANAHRLVRAFGDDLIATSHGWYIFTGKHWRHDDQLAESKALNLSRLILQEPEYLALQEQLKRPGIDDSAQKAAKNWLDFAKRCEDKPKITAALNLARTLLWRDIEELNVDRWLFNVQNGTIDLRTGVLRPHDRADLITAIAPVEYAPKEDCPTFRKTVLEALNNETELAAFLQRYLGYCLTGLTTDQVILIPWGDGSNGKGTILSTVQRVMGHDYCGSAAPKLLESTKSDRHPTEIADLYGKRLVIASETEEGSGLREAFLKLATGGDVLKARFMHKDFFEFEPTHKFVLQTNHKPEVKGTDFAIWRRLLLLPFDVIFGDEAAVHAGDAAKLKDPSLPDKLSREFDGVLTWLVQGCLDWQRIGLNPPPGVKGATAAYREEQDRVGQFLAEECELDPRHEVLQQDMYQKYSGWALRNGYIPMGSSKFAKQLLKATRGKVIRGRTNGTNLATYCGIAGRVNAML